MADWDEAGAGALSGAGVGAEIGSVIPGVGTAIGAGAGALVGGVAGLFSHKETPQYNDPNAVSRKILADNLMSAKTGEEFAAHQSAMNEHRGKELFDQVSKEYSGNPAISSSLYNNIERNVENENTTAGIEGARINQENQRTAANILNEDSSLGFKEWTANTDRANMPSALDTIAKQGLGQLAGKGFSAMGNGSGESSSVLDRVPPSPDIQSDIADIQAPVPDTVSKWNGRLPGMNGDGGELTGTE